MGAGVSLPAMFTTVQDFTVNEPRHRSALALMVMALTLAASGAAHAQPYDRTWTSCLLKPEASTDATRDCTVVIDSGKASATEKAIALNNRGVDAKTPETALRDFDEAIKLNTGNAEAYFNRGLVFRDRGDADRAARDLEHDALDEHAGGADDERRGRGPRRDRGRRGRRRNRRSRRSR